METERLRIRAWRTDDAADYLALYGDPDVMRYLASGDLPPIPDVEAARRSLERIVQRDAAGEDGLGMWALEERASGRVIGAAGLWPLDDGRIEIAYHIAKDRWGDGFATEAARAVAAYGFDALGLERIVAIVYPENAASIRVIEKLGMLRDGTLDAFGRTFPLYVLERVRSAG